MASTEVERDARLETAEVPSAQWGWSRINHRTWHITGGIIVIFLLAMMLFRNHSGHIEDWFLLVFVASTLFVIGRDWWGRRRGWLR